MKGRLLSSSMAGERLVATALVGFKQGLMKLVIAIIVLVVALALAGSAEAKQARTAHVHVTLVGQGCGVTGLECGNGGGGSCLCFVAFWNFAGDTNIGSLGSLAFTGAYSDGYFCSEIGPDLTCLVPLTYERSLTLTFTAANGDRLVLDESFSSSTPFPLLSEGDNPVQGAWNVDPAQSSGRFRRYTGSGTYTLDYENENTFATFAIALDGSLTFAHG